MQSLPRRIVRIVSLQVLASLAACGPTQAEIVSLLPRSEQLIYANGGTGSSIEIRGIYVLPMIRLGDGPGGFFLEDPTTPKNPIFPAIPESLIDLQFDVGTLHKGVSVASARLNFRTDFDGRGLLELRSYSGDRPIVWLDDWFASHIRTDALTFIRLSPDSNFVLDLPIDFVTDALRGNGNLGLRLKLSDEVGGNQGIALRATRNIAEHGDSEGVPNLEIHLLPEPCTQAILSIGIAGLLICATRHRPGCRRF